MYVGRFPDDRRAFNAVCIMPAGKIPDGYKNIYYAGMPAPDGCVSVEIPKAGWTAEMPGLDELRRAYVAMKKLLSRPVMADGLAGYARSGAHFQRSIA